MHHGEVARGFTGEKWTQDERAAEDFALNRIAGRHGNGFSFKRGLIFFNSNGGAQAMQLAWQKGARRLVLIGFDGYGKHFFGDHGPGLRNDYPFKQFRRAFEVMHRDCKRAGIEIVNTSLASTYKLPKATLRCALQS